MTRNVIKSDFWSSKMAVGGHFVNKIKQKVAYDVFVYDLAYLLNLITVVVGAYYRVNTVLQFQRDILLPQLIQYFLPPHMGELPPPPPPRVAMK